MNTILRTEVFDAWLKKNSRMHVEKLAFSREFEPLSMETLVIVIQLVKVYQKCEFTLVQATVYILLK